MRAHRCLQISLAALAVVACGGKKSGGGDAGGEASGEFVAAGAQPVSSGMGAGGFGGAIPPIVKANTDGCVSTEAFFAAQIWQAAIRPCATCHQAGGLYESQGGDLFVLDPAGDLHIDYAAALATAQVEAAGESLLPRRARGEDGHKGGVVFPTSREEYALLATFASHARAPVECSDDPELAEATAAASTESPAAGGEEDDTASDTGGAVAGCQGPFALFQAETWKSALASCTGCHMAGGFYEVSGGQDFVLTAGGATVANFAIVKTLAARNAEDGAPLLVVKSSGGAGHQGGAVLATGSDGAEALGALVESLRDPAQCAAGSSEQTESEAAEAEGLILLSPEATLRKAAIRLAGRIPTPSEQASVAQGGIPALEQAVAAMMTEPAFYRHLKNLFNDLLLTDGVKFENRWTGVIDFALPSSLLNFPLTWGNFPGYLPNNDLNGAAADSMAREPLELIAHVVRQNRPFTEILTAKYRLLNRLGAEALKYDPASLGFQGAADDYDEYIEMQLPQINGEYAGILTTTAFLYRYPDTGSNRNRKRARYFYKHFLGFDIMKDSVRIDLSKVDLTASPWRNNAACTGCHKVIDPVAGAFQNWTNCYGSNKLVYLQKNERYCGNGPWFAASDMFQPGTGPESAASKILPEETHKALELLAAATVQKRAFARTMTGHVLSGLVGTGGSSELREATIETLTDAFIESGHDLKALVVAIVKTPLFRAQGATALLGPEKLHDKITSTMGHAWGVANSKVLAAQKPRRNDDPHHLLSMKKYRLLAGGIDSVQITKRATNASTLHAAVSSRMAYEMSCEYAAQDFALPAAQRTLFPYVERQLLPTPANKPAILQNLAHLHRRFLGEELAAGDAELEATWALLVDAWQTGKTKIEAGSASSSLTSECRADTLPDSGAAVQNGYSDDPQFVVRAWQAVLAYVLLDYKTLYE